MAEDITSKEEILNTIDKIHEDTNHRGVRENYEEIRSKFFYPKLFKIINKYINACKVCNECKYDRKPIRKKFEHTVTPEGPNKIVHLDIFHVKKISFLTTIDKFTKLGTVHKLNDKNMVTIKTKLEERIALLGKPETIVMDNEFNNGLIKMFCNQKNIKTHFTTAHSHTGNADIERFHSTLLEHIRVLNARNENDDTEEMVITAVGHYNNTIHSTTGLKPIDFINKLVLHIEKIRARMDKSKKDSINRINRHREENPEIDKDRIFTKNPEAARNKVAKRFVKRHSSNPNKIDIALIKRPRKTFTDSSRDLRNIANTRNNGPTENRTE